MITNCQIHKDLIHELKKKSIASEKEICGFIVENQKFIECENIHPDPYHYFLISPNHYIWGDDVILFHSHPKICEEKGFSKWDLENQFYFQLKMLLYSVKYDEFYFSDL